MPLTPPATDPPPVSGEPHDTIPCPPPAHSEPPADNAALDDESLQALRDWWSALEH